MVIRSRDIYFVFQSAFMQTEHASSLETLKDIRSIMERSARFVSLSGWSGVWAGGVALISAWIAQGRINDFVLAMRTGAFITQARDIFYLEMFVLAAVTFLMAGAGAFFFTMKKVRKQGMTLWGSASRKLMISVMIPMLAGGVFAIAFLLDGNESYIAPACLAFYGLALVNGGKYTIGEIRYLGYSELVLGCICLFFPGEGLYLWAAGFGVLHILYGIIMWNKYDKSDAA